MKSIRFVAAPVMVAALASTGGALAEDCCTLDNGVTNGPSMGVKVTTACEGDDCAAKPATKKVDLSARGINGGEGGDAGGEAGAAD